MPRTPGIALIILLAVRSVQAEERVPIRVTYSAPSACPVSAELTRQMLARSARLRPAEADELARELVFEIESDTTRYRGSFALAVGTGTTERRVVVGEDCAEVVRALSLIAALAVDPEARVELEPPAAEAKATPLEAPFPTSAPTAPQPAATSVAVASRDNAKPREPFALAVGLRLEAETGLGTPLAPVPRAVLNLGLAQNITIGFAAGGTRTEVRRGGGGMALSLAAVRLEGCVATVKQPVLLQPCLGLDSGSLAAHPEERDADLDWVSSGDHRLWLTPLAGLRFAWSPARDRTRPHLELETLVAAACPMVRAEYFFRFGEDRTVVHTVPPLTGVFGLGLALRFGDR